MNKTHKFAVSISVMVCLITFVAAPLAAQCTPPPPGLISWWPAEGDATDLTGGNNGTLMGATVFAAGMVGQAFKFGGADNDAVDVGAAPNLQLQSFSIEGWVSRASTLKVSLSTTPGGGAGFFAFGSNGYAFGMVDDGRLDIGKVDVDGVFSTNVKVTDLNFHHVAVTKSGGTVTFYVDGVPDTPITYNTSFSFTGDAAIGARGDNVFARGNFLGIIDELSVYDRDLTAAEIQAIVAAGSDGKCPPIP